MDSPIRRQLVVSFIEPVGKSPFDPGSPRIGRAALPLGAAGQSRRGVPFSVTPFPFGNSQYLSCLFISPVSLRLLFGCVCFRRRAITVWFCVRRGCVLVFEYQCVVFC